MCRLCVNVCRICAVLVCIFLHHSRCLHCHTLLTVDQEDCLPCSSKRYSVYTIHTVCFPKVQGSLPHTLNDWKRTEPVSLLTAGCLSVMWGRSCTSTRGTLSGRSTPTCPSCSPGVGASGRCTGCEHNTYTHNTEYRYVLT